jgi:ribokinase
MSIHVIGNACIDTTFVVDRLPQAGETTNADGFRIGFGGKGLNQAVAAKRAGADVWFWAAIGRDAEGDSIASCLATEGIGIEGLVRLAVPTDRSSLLVDRCGENLIVSAVACAQAFDPLADTVVSEMIGPGDTVILQGNLRSEVTGGIVSLARSCGCKVVFNASPLGADAASLPGEVDLLIVNRHEAEVLSGLGSPIDAAKSLCARGATAVVITLGSDGVLFCSAGDIRSVPAIPVATIDTSGAGDVFCGVLAAALDLKFSLANSVAVANRAAAIATTRRGTLASGPTRDELVTCFQNL